MAVRETGGAAFPTLDYLWPKRDQYGDVGYSPSMSGGMSLRDYFAAQAMSQPDVRLASIFSARWAAWIAYVRADAMLAEREKGGA